MTTDLPASQHQPVRVAQGREFVERAAAELYYCALQCRADGHPWPADLDRCHALLWRHLQRDERERRRMVGPVGETP